MKEFLLKCVCSIVPGELSALADEKEYYNER